jgi:SAM-dependent methyltransferase
VLDRFYGCGSPVTAANPQPGETYVDLGSGAGIDCFIAAKHVGPGGTVIGVDMTDQMLAVARDSSAKVAAALGYAVVEFRKGYLEQIPVEDKIADVVTSNCVINLSPDKPKVLAEIWRILKDHGRTVIADIVSDREVPPRLKVNEQLWGECIVGALTEEQFLAMLEQAGFYGFSVLKKTFWKTIEGFNFYSVTAQGFKFEKTAGCQFIGQRAIYKGPFKAALDEEGHLFPRNVAIEVCTDTAAKLSRAPYAGQFVIVEPSGERQDVAASACCPGGNTGGCC